MWLRLRHDSLLQAARTRVAQLEGENAHLRQGSQSVRSSSQEIRRKGFSHSWSHSEIFLSRNRRKRNNWCKNSSACSLHTKNWNCSFPSCPLPNPRRKPDCLVCPLKKAAVTSLCTRSADCSRKSIDFRNIEMRGFSLQPPSGAPFQQRPPARQIGGAPPGSGFQPFVSGFQPPVMRSDPGFPMQPSQRGSPARGRGHGTRGGRPHDVQMREEPQPRTPPAPKRGPPIRRGLERRGHVPEQAWVRERPQTARGSARLNRLDTGDAPYRPMRRGGRNIPRRQSIKEEDKEDEQEESAHSSADEDQSEEELEGNAEEAEDDDAEGSEGEEESEGGEGSGEEINSGDELESEELSLREKALMQKQRLLRALQVREKPKPILRTAPKPPAKPAVTGDFSPISPQSFELCSKTEADRRYITRALSIYEMLPNSDALGAEKPEYKDEWVVKEYTRSAAGLVQSADARRNPVLTNTLDYLFMNILDVDKRNPCGYSNPPHSTVHRFIDIYRFISNRARAVTKDYQIAGETKTQEYVRDLERIARFHTLSAAEGLDYSKMEDESLRFEYALNFKRLENILISLEEAYKQVPGSHPQEGEFIAYKLIMRIDNQRLVQKWIKDTPARLRQHPLFLLAEKVVQHYHTNNYYAFFQLIPEAPFLIAALMTMSFDKVRLHALKCIQQSYTEPLQVEVVAKWLGFADVEEAEEYLLFRGADLSSEGVKLKGLELSEEKFVFSSAPANVMAKMPALRWNVIHDQPVFNPPPPPPVEQKIAAPKPVESPAPPRPPKPSTIPLTPVMPPSPKIVPPQPIVQTPLEAPKPPAPIMAPAPPPVVRPKPQPKQQFNEFRFPASDPEFLEIAESREERDEMKASIREYRKKVRAKSNRAAEKQKLAILFYRFSHWKGTIQLSHVEAEIAQEVQNEAKKFRSNLSREVIDDFQFPRDSPVQQPAKSFSEAFESLIHTFHSVGHTFFKVSILSYGVPSLDELLEKSVFSQAEKLKAEGLLVNSDVTNADGSDVVMLILSEGELGTVHFPYLPRCALFILWVSEIQGLSEADMVEVLDLKKTHFLTIDMTIVDPLYLSASGEADTRLRDMVLQPLETLMREAVPKRLTSLQLTRVRDLPRYYEEGMERLSTHTKTTLLRHSLAAGNAWVQVINQLHLGLLHKLDSLYAAVLPSPELLEKMGVRDFARTIKDYKPLRCVIDRLQLNLLPSANDFTFSREEAEAFLLDYAYGAVNMCEELIPGSSSSLLYELQRVFTDSPVQVIASGLQVPWDDYFLCVLTHQLMCIGNFAGTVYLDAAPMEVDDTAIVSEQHLELESLNDVVRERYHVDYYQPARTLFPELATAFKRQRPKPAAPRPRIEAEPEIVKQPRTTAPVVIRSKPPDLLSELRKSRLQRQEVQQMLSLRK